MNITIKAAHFSTLASTKDNGLYDLTEIARDLRLDFPETRKLAPHDWMKVNSSGIEHLNEVYVAEDRVFGTLMAVYVYIDWINSQAECNTKLIKVFPDSEVVSQGKSTGERLDFVEATLDNILDTVCENTYKTFECEDAKYDVRDNLQVYDESIHLKATIKQMLAILRDSSATSYTFDKFHGLR